MQLDIKKLIEKAEGIVNDEQLGFAAQIKYPVQEITLEGGVVYELSVVMAVKK